MFKIPGQYHIKEELVKDSIKVPVSCFKSKTVRKMAASPISVSEFSFCNLAVYCQG